jgi:uncharacterized membrane protein YjgN (DUF898 family)
MKLKAEIKAEITALPYDVNPCKRALFVGFSGYYECPIVLKNGTWHCKIAFPDTNGQVELGQTTNALIRFLRPNEALQGVSLGDTFQLLREDGPVAIGKVTEFIVPPIREELKLEFIGSWREYFRIWIVNLCLTLVTLGIFSAWAKVRKNRYYYSHTLLDDTPFLYLGQPLPILRGRIIAVVLFCVYYVSSHFLPSLQPFVLTIAAVLAPWVIIRSVAFKARYSAFRNMTFQFRGNYWNAVKVVSAWGLIPAILVAMMFKWWQITWLKAVLFAIAGLLFPWWISRFKSFLVGYTVFGGKNGRLTTTGAEFFGIYFLASVFFILIIIAAGLSVSILHIARHSAYHVAVFSIPAYVGYVFSYAYIQAHTHNLVWNKATLGPLRFRSTLSGLVMAKYYLTNGLAIVASAGLLIPWAVMRTMKYKVDSLHVLVTGELNDFRGSDMTSVSAVGMELGDFFNMDLSL